MITHIKQEFITDILEGDDNQVNESAILNQIFDTENEQEKNQDNSSILKNLITSDHTSLQLVEHSINNIQPPINSQLIQPTDNIDTTHILTPNGSLETQLPSNKIPEIDNIDKDSPHNIPNDINLFNDKKFTFHNINAPPQFASMQGQFNQFKFDDKFNSDFPKVT